MISLKKEATDKLNIKGRIVFPSDPHYEQTRQIWNAMIERRPAAIVQCAETSDVPLAIAFARQHGLEISVRGAGHNIGGNALCDDGLVIDLSTMKRVWVDTQNKRAYV